MGILLSRRIIFLALICILFTSLSACSSALPAGPTPTGINTAVPPSPTGSPAATATAVAAATMPEPTPTSQPPLAILLAPSGSDSGLAGALETALADLSSQSGLRFEVRSALSPSELDASLRLVVALPPDPGLADLASAAPGTQFLAVGIPGLELAPNLSVVGAQGSRPDLNGFIAGYLAAAVTPDWRVGMIGLQGSPAGLAARQAFVNGVVFFCGLCRPSYPPFHAYPVTFELSEGASQADQQAAVSFLKDNSVQTVYVFPGAGDESLLELLAQAEIHIIGGVNPPPSIKNRWVASVQSDLLAAVQDLLPGLLNGAGGEEVDVPLMITNQNSDLFSPARQRLVDETLADLLAGFVDTGIDPVTGEPR